MPSAQALLVPCPPPPDSLCLTSPLLELARRVRNIYLVKQISNVHLVLALGVLEIIIQVPQYKRNAVVRTGVPRCPKLIHPYSVVGGDVYPHHIESFIPHDELEGYEVGGGHVGCLHLKRIMTFLPRKGNPSLFVARCFCQDDFIPQSKLGVTVAQWQLQLPSALTL